MEACPQCNAERISGENFCDNCGHKYASDGQQQPDVQQIPTTAQSGKLSINDANGMTAISIQFDDVPKTIGRADFSDFLVSQGKDPLQISRKQCTIFREGDNYYIEDGITSVQDKPSGNHTIVNDQDITGSGRVKLTDNDRIVLATLINATFRIE